MPLKGKCYPNHSQGISGEVKLATTSKPEELVIGCLAELATRLEFVHSENDTALMQSGSRGSTNHSASIKTSEKRSLS